MLSKGCSQTSETRKQHPQSERMETLPLGAHLCPKTRASLLTEEIRESEEDLQHLLQMNQGLKIIHLYTVLSRSKYRPGCISPNHSIRY